MTDQTVVELKPYVPSAKALRRIAKRQAIWDKSTDEQRRVLVAKDVIKQLKRGRINARRGWFIDERVAWDAQKAGNTDYWSSGLRDLFLDGQLAKCDACALGSMFVSCTLFNNKVNYRQLGGMDIGNNIAGRKLLPNGLNAVFSRKQLMLIENAFEMGMGYFDSEYTGQEDAPSASERGDAIAFGSEYRFSHTDRLIAIMQNIVKNGGEFKP